MADKDSYSVEVREPTRGGADYTEEHYDFETPEEVRNFIKNDMHEDEGVHSVWFYPAEGESRDVSRKFY